MKKLNFIFIISLLLSASCTQDYEDMSGISTKTYDEIVEIKNILELRSLSGTQGQKIKLLGYYSKNDKEAVEYIFQEGNYEDNGGSIIIPYNNPNGAWITNIHGFVSIKHYGAVGDTITNNTEIINNCIINHDSVRIPEGVFRTNTIQAKSNLTIEGEGELRLINTMQTHLFSIIDLENIVIRNIRLNGNHEVDLTQEPIHSFGVNLRGKSKNINIENVSFKNFGKDAIYINESNIGDGKYPESIYINNCKIEYSQRHGIAIISAKDVFIDNCDIQYCKLNCIDIEPNTGSTLIDEIYVRQSKLDRKYIGDNATIQCSLGDIQNNPSIYKNIYLIGNTVTNKIRNKGFQNTFAIDNTITYIHYGISDFSVIRDNTLYYNKTTELRENTTGGIMTSLDSTLIENNNIFGASYNGIVLYESSHCRINNNIIKDFGQLQSGSSKSAGIYIVREGNNNRMIGNHISNSIAETSYGISGSKSSGNIIKDNTFNVSVKYVLNFSNQEYVE